MPAAYGVFAATGCATAVLWLARHRDGIGVSENELWGALWALLVGGVVGAKALFVVLGWEHYAHGELRLWADFGVGFVFFGGLVGALAAGALVAWVRRLDFVRGADYFAVAVPLGHAIGRVGCQWAGCCQGRPPHPVPLYEAAGLVLIAIACRRALVRVEAGTWARGSAFRLYLALYGGLRVLLDPLRADGRPERFLGLSHQQGIALLAIAVALAWAWVAPRGREASSAASAAGHRVDPDVEVTGRCSDATRRRRGGVHPRWPLARNVDDTLDRPAPGRAGRWTRLGGAT